MDVGLLILRLTVGLTLAAHGTQKLFGWFGGPGIDAVGLRFARAVPTRPAPRADSEPGRDWGRLGVAALTLAFTGPGALSLAALFGHDLSGTLWGGGAFLIGVLGGVVALVRRRPIPTQPSATDG